MEKIKKICLGLCICLCMIFLPMTIKETEASTTYQINVGQFEHGSVKLSKQSAEKNEKVSITVSPDTGYAMDDLTVTTENGQQLALTVSEKKYEFYMPETKVQINAGFKEKRTLKLFNTYQLNHAIDTTNVTNGIKVFKGNGLELIPDSLATSPLYTKADSYNITDGIYYLKMYNTSLDIIQEQKIEVNGKDENIYYISTSVSLGKVDGKSKNSVGLEANITDDQGNEIRPFTTSYVNEGTGIKDAKYLIYAGDKNSVTIKVKAANPAYKVNGSEVDTVTKEIPKETAANWNGKTYALTSKDTGTKATFYISKGADANIYLHDGKAYKAKTKVLPFTVDCTSNSKYDIYTFQGIEGEGSWIVCGGGTTPYKRTALNFMFKGKDSASPVTIDLKKKDEKVNHTPWLLENDLYTNVEESYLTPKVNQSKLTLEGFRVQQTVSSVLGNNFIDPEMHYDIIYGDSVELTSTGAIGREYQKMTAKKPGLSVIKITYDDLDYREISLDRPELDDYLYCDAIDPINTGIVIVNVGGTSEGIDSGIKLTDFDTVYIPEKTVLPDGKEIKGTETVPYTFKPTSTKGNLTVSTHDPIHLNENWNDGWTVYQADDEGNYTINLKEGRNIVCIQSGDSVLYKIINAKKMTATVENISRNGKTPQNGDVLSVSFKGLELPVYKMCGIYNPGYPDQTWVQYYLNDKETPLESDHTQYDIEKRNTITFAVDSSSNIVLSGGQIHCVHLGSALYAHCKISTTGVLPNLSATTGKNSPYFDIFPDITIPVVGKEVGVMDLINEIDTANYLGCIDKIMEAWDAYDTLTDEEKEKVTNADILNTAYEAVKDIIELIKAIDALPDEVTLDNQEAVEAANAAYTAMTLERQAAVSNADKLKNAVAVIQTLSARQERIQTVIAQINALPETAKVTKADAESIAAARAAYAALLSDEQEEVTNAEKLTEAETQLGYVEAASTVMDAIAAIGDVTLDNYETKYELIVMARSVYDNLADGAKALVTNLDVLTKAEETYQVMDEDVKEVIDAIDTLKKPLSESNAEMSAEELKEIWDAYTYVVANTRGLADELTKDKQAIVSNIADLETAEGYVQRIKIAAIEKADQDTEKDIAEKIYDEAKALVTALPAASEYTPAEGADPITIPTETVQQIAQAQAVVGSLSDKQKEALTAELENETKNLKNLDDLAALAQHLDGYDDQIEATKAELDREADEIRDVAAVNQYIAELTGVYNTYKDTKDISRSEITVIRQTTDAYEELSDAQKKIIAGAEDADVITQMLDTLKVLSAQVEKDEKDAREVTEYINNLPTSLNLDNMEAVHSDLKMIVEKYNALNANAQSYVRKVSKVTALNNVLNTMTTEINTFREGKPEVAATAMAYNSVTVSWKEYQYAQSYDVYRKTAGGEWTKLANTTALQYIDQTTAGSTAYSYTVVALSSRWGQSVSSAYDENGAAVTTPAAPVTPQPDNGNVTPDNGSTTPDAGTTTTVSDYTGLKAVSAGCNRIKVSWKKIKGADGYVLYRATSANGKYKALKTIKKAKTTSYTDKNRATGKTYYYKLRPYKNVKHKKQYMAYSTVVSTKAMPGKVKFTKLTAKNSKATLKWKKVSGASGYLIYRSDRSDGGFKCINSLSGRKTGYTNTKLKKGQTYYYRIRAYKKSGKKRIYGDFSVVKAVRVR